MVALKHLQILVTPQVDKQIRKLARNHGLSIAATVRSLIDEALRERNR